MRIAATFVAFAVFVTPVFATDMAARLGKSDPKDYAVIDIANHLLQMVEVCHISAQTADRLKEIVAAAEKRAGATPQESRQMFSASVQDASVGVAAAKKHPNNQGQICASIITMVHGMLAQY